jgi:hypothetical protein
MDGHATANTVRAFDRAYINGQFVTPHGTQLVDGDGDRAANALHEGHSYSSFYTRSQWGGAAKRQIRAG